MKWTYTIICFQQSHLVCLTHGYGLSIHLLKRGLKLFMNHNVNSRLIEININNLKINTKCRTKTAYKFINKTLHSTVTENEKQFSFRVHQQMYLYYVFGSWLTNLLWFEKISQIVFIFFNRDFYSFIVRNQSSFSELSIITRAFYVNLASTFMQRLQKISIKD